MREKELKEGLGDLAHLAEQDHEVQMARAELYKLAKYAIKLHEMLKGISERDGLEGWVQSKITKSADMIGSVYHHLEYQESPMGEVTETKKADKFTPHTMYDPKTGKSKKANKEQDHIDMAKKGWTHDKPKKVDIEESACNCDCGKAICESCGKAHKVSESGLQAHIGNKKYGKAGMDKLRKAGREGGGEEAKGKIKDKILGKKTESAEMARNAALDKASDSSKEGKKKVTLKKAPWEKDSKKDEGIIGAVAGGVLGSAAGPLGTAAGAYLGHKVTSSKKSKKKPIKKKDETYKESLQGKLNAKLGK